jgi:hypothetical protein
MKAFNWFTLFALVIFTSCRPDKPIPFCEEFPEQCVDMEKIKDHYYFKTGSWWVYQEVNSHQLDTQWVSQGWVDDCNFDMVIKTSRDDYDRHRWTHLLTPSKDCGLVEKRRLAYIERSKGKAGSHIGTSFIGIFHPIIGDYVYNNSVSFSNNTIKIKNIHNVLTQLSFTFNNVIEYFENSNKTENNQPVKTFYAKGVGLIKKELLDSNQIWLLIDYDVEQ